MQVLGTWKPKAASDPLQDSSFGHFRPERQSTNKEAFKEVQIKQRVPFAKSKGHSG